MMLASKKYSGKGWNSMGPPLFTNHLRGCILNSQQKSRLLGVHKQCGVEVLPPEIFFPIQAGSHKMLLEEHPDKFWAKIFFNSTFAHFYSQTTGSRYQRQEYCLIFNPSKPIQILDL